MNTAAAGGLAAAERLVRGAQRRLALGRALERAADGLLAGAVLAALGVAAGALGLVAGPSPALLWLAAAGAAAGFVAGALARPDTARAALALDRAARSDEAFVSALTADGAAPAFRELAAAYGLAVVAGRRPAALLPLPVPARAVPAAAALALAVAVLVVAAPSGDAAAQPRAPEVVEGTAGGGGAAGATDAPGARPGAAAVPVPGTRSATDTPLPALPGAPTEDEVRRLAEDLAARGLAAGRDALAALARGDAAAAEELLRAALAAPGGAAGAAGGAAAAARAGAPGPGAWSVPRWPLRYDRQVRAWLEQCARDAEAR